MNWIAKVSGNMTLGVFEGKRQIVKIDMLKMGTMKAGTNGYFLCRAMNDLTVIASFCDRSAKLVVNGIIPYPDVGVSPIPWNIDLSKPERIVIKDAKNKKIAERVYGKSESQDQIEKDRSLIIQGVEKLNSR